MSGSNSERVQPVAGVWTSQAADPLPGDLLEQVPAGIAIEDSERHIVRCNAAFCTLTGLSLPDIIGHKLEALLVHERQSEGEWQERTVNSPGDTRSRVCVHIRAGKRVWLKEVVALIHDPLGTPLRHVTLLENVSSHRTHHELIREERAFVKAVISNVPAGLLACNAAGEIVLYNQRAAQYFAIPGDASDEPGISGTYPVTAEIFAGDGLTPMPREQRPLARTLRGESLQDFAQVVRLPDGERRHLSVNTHRVVGEQGDFLGAVSISQDVTEKRQVEEKVGQLQRSLQDASHAAGMAEIATNVLHNVGNALNGVNVSANLLSTRVRRSRIDGVRRLLDLMGRDGADPAAFFAQPGRSAQLLAFLTELSGALEAERDATLAEIASMQRNVEHIKAIVDMQQTYARHTGVFEEVDLAEVIEDSLHINAGACLRHGVTVRRELAGVPRIVTQRHKVMQILVNLIRNAKYACDAGGVEPKQVTVSATPSPLGVRISVQDTGIGIAADHMPRLFTHGFTTKPDGHGFGLHSAALAARELGGSLLAHSEGIGHGACFTLELPLRRPENDHVTR